MTWPSGRYCPKSSHATEVGGCSSCNMLMTCRMITIDNLASGLKRINSGWPSLTECLDAATIYKKVRPPLNTTNVRMRVHPPMLLQWKLIMDKSSSNVRSSWEVDYHFVASCRAGKDCQCDIKYHQLIPWNSVLAVLLTVVLQYTAGVASLKSENDEGELLSINGVSIND